MFTIFQSYSLYRIISKHMTNRLSVVNFVKFKTFYHDSVFKYYNFKLLCNKLKHCTCDHCVVSQIVLITAFTITFCDFCRHSSRMDWEGHYARYCFSHACFAYAKLISETACTLHYEFRYQLVCFIASILIAAFYQQIK